LAISKDGKFDLNLLPIAVAILDARSVSKAADTLGMSQPSVSAALRKLRTVFGDRLFVKSARGVEPTPRALALVSAARVILSHVREELFSELSFDPFKYKDSFNLGLTEIGELLYLPSILERMKRLAPQATVRSVSVRRDEIGHELRSGRVDLVIGNYRELPDKNVYKQGLFPFEYACLLRADHPLRSARPSFAELLRLQYVFVRSQLQPVTGIFEQFMAHKMARSNASLVAANWLCIPRIVATSDLAAFLPLHLAVYYCKTMPNLRVVSVPTGFPSFVISQYWHGRFQDDPKIKWLRSLISQLLSGGPGSSIKLIMGLKPSNKRAESISAVL
jgi:DNA-binding transcriptional LysR family regulator